MRKDNRWTVDTIVILATWIFAFLLGIGFWYVVIKAVLS